MNRRFSSNGNFFVRDKSGEYYPATFLTDADGRPIVNSIARDGLSPPYRQQDLALYTDRSGTVLLNPNHYLVVPSADYMNNMADRGRLYGGLLQGAELADKNDTQSAMNARAAAELHRIETFAPKLGYGDAQYQGEWEHAIPDTRRAIVQSLLGPDRARAWGIGPSDMHWIPAFTDAGNYGVGVFYGAGGRAREEALRAFGAANLWHNPSSATSPYGNSRWGYPAINQGYDDIVDDPSMLTNSNLNSRALPNAAIQISSSPAGNLWDMPGNGILSGVRLGPGKDLDSRAAGLANAGSAWDQAVREMWAKRSQGEDSSAP